MKKWIAIVLVLSAMLSSCASLEDRRAERKERIESSFPAHEARAILEQKIFRGMSRRALIESWGRPSDINKSVGSWGTHEQFVYGRYGSLVGVTYVYVENGKVTGWQS